MSRPPVARDSAIQSIAFAVCGSARATAAATVASSALIRHAISRDDLVSRSAERGFGCSVGSESRFSVFERLLFITFAVTPDTRPSRLHHEIGDVLV